jgi:tRNA dimethylallyltransferase
VTAIRDIHCRGRVAIVCGGTGMYIQSLIGGLAPIPAADQDLRNRLRHEERLSPGTLHARLAEMDPASASRIHPNDILRLVRALEVAELAGVPMSRLRDEAGVAQPGFEALMLQVDVARDELYSTIDRRSEEIVDAGLVDELSELRRHGYPRDARAFSAIGYREAGRCLDGLLEPSQLAGAVAQATRQYAKRQLTWLRGRAVTSKVERGDVDTALRLAERFLNSVANG